MLSASVRPPVSGRGGDCREIARAPAGPEAEQIYSQPAAGAVRWPAPCPRPPAQCPPPPLTPVNPPWYAGGVPEPPGGPDDQQERPGRGGAAAPPDGPRRAAGGRARPGPARGRAGHRASRRAGAGRGGPRRAGAGHVAGPPGPDLPALRVPGPGRAPERHLGRRRDRAAPVRALPGPGPLARWHDRTDIQQGMPVLPYCYQYGHARTAILLAPGPGDRRGPEIFRPGPPGAGKNDTPRAAREGGFT